MIEYREIKCKNYRLNSEIIVRILIYGQLDTCIKLCPVHVLKSQAYRSCNQKPLTHILFIINHNISTINNIHYIWSNKNGFNCNDNIYFSECVPFPPIFKNYILVYLIIEKSNSSILSALTPVQASGNDNVIPSVKLSAHLISQQTSKWHMRFYIHYVQLCLNACTARVGWSMFAGIFYFFSLSVHTGRAQSVTSGYSRALLTVRMYIEKNVLTGIKESLTQLSLLNCQFAFHRIQKLGWLISQRS